MQTIITENGQFIISEANIITALGLPNNVSIIGASWDTSQNQLTITAVEQISNTGTP